MNRTISISARTAAVLAALGMSFYALSLSAQPRLTAEQLSALSPIQPQAVPRSSTFWDWTASPSGTLAAPLPCDPYGADVPIYQVGIGQYFLGLPNLRGPRAAGTRGWKAPGTGRLESLPYELRPSASKLAAEASATAASWLAGIESGAYPRVTNPPRCGTFRSLQRPDYPPLPCAPEGLGLAVFSLGDGSMVVDDRSLDYKAMGAQAALEQAALAATLPAPQAISYPAGSLWLSVGGVSATDECWSCSSYI